MSIKDCYATSLEELKYFDHDALLDYTQRVLARADEIDNKRGMKAIEQAMKEINDEKNASYFWDMQAMANDAEKLTDASDKVRKGQATLMSVMIKRNENLADNAEAQIQFKRDMYFKKVYGESTREQQKYLQNPDNQLRIAAVVDGGKATNPYDEFWAKTLMQYKNLRNADLVVENALALERLNDDRFLKQVHRQDRLISGNTSAAKAAIDANYGKHLRETDARTFWREKIKKRLDIEKTFQFTHAADELGNIDMRTVDKIIDNIYDDITTGESNVETTSSAVNDRQALSRKGRLFFHWKSFTDQLEYNKEFGTGNLFTMIQADINSSAHKSGIAKVMGTSPNDFFNGLRKVQLEKDFEKRKSKTGRLKNNLWLRQADINFNTLKGADQQIQNPTLANITDNANSIISMSRLGLVTLRSFSDVGFQTAFHVKQGENPFIGMFHIVRQAFDRYSDEETKAIAKSMKIMVDTQLGYAGRWSDQTAASDIVTKATGGFFKVVGLEALDRGSKMGSMTLMSRRLYQLRNKSWSELPKARRVFLQKFISAPEWEAMRTVKPPIKAMTYENMKNVTDDNLRELKSLNPKKSFNDLRNDLARKVFSMHSVASENAVMNPLVWERGMVNRAFAKGTPGGVATSIVGQFTKFSVAWVDRAVQHGWQDTGAAGTRVSWATTMLLMGAPFGILGDMLTHLAQGQFYNVYDAYMGSNDYDKDQMILNMLASTIGMYTGILEPRSQDANMGLSLLASPGTRFIGYGLAAAASAINYGIHRNPKDLKRMKKDFYKMASQMLPLQNIPILSPLINQVIGQKTYQDKGSTQFFGS